MNAPIRELPQAARPADISAEEWALRLELAACYRLFAHLGWSEMIFNHITLRVPGAEPHFLINPYGLHYSEVTARNLVKIDLAGAVIGESAYPINPAGFVIHSAIHANRPDAHCIIHTHTTAGIAVACKKEGLAFDNFYSAQFWGRVAYHDFEGVTTDLAEQQRLVASLAQRRGADPAQPRPARRRPEHSRGLHRELVAAARLRGAARRRRDPRPERPDPRIGAARDPGAAQADAGRPQPPVPAGLRRDAARRRHPPR